MYDQLSKTTLNLWKQFCDNLSPYSSITSYHPSVCPCRATGETIEQTKSPVWMNTIIISPPSSHVFNSKTNRTLLRSITVSVVHKFTKYRRGKRYQWYHCWIIKKSDFFLYWHRLNTGYDCQKIWYKKINDKLCRLQIPGKAAMTLLLMTNYRSYHRY